MFILGLLSNDTFCQQTDIQNYVYDTIIVYDTVFEYETIYDTVWVYDTIYIDNTELPLSYMIPLSIKYLNFSSQYLKQIKLPDWYKQMHTALYKKNTRESKSRNRTKEFFLKSKHFHFSPQLPKMTLNPNHGKFDARLLTQGDFAIGAYGGIEFSITDANLDFSKNENQWINGSFSDSKGLNYGISLNYIIAPFALQTGLGIMNLSERFSYIETITKIDSTKTSENALKWVTNTDSVRVYNLNKLLLGDTVWNTHYYTYDTLVQYDSVYYLYDTLKNDINKHENITHQMLEIPLLFIYNMQYSRLALQFKLGVVNQIHLFTKGNIPNGLNEYIEASKVFNYKKYNIALYMGVAIDFRISERLGVNLGTFYKYPFIHFSELASTRIKKQTYGINMGISYYF